VLQATAKQMPKTESLQVFLLVFNLLNISWSFTISPIAFHIPYFSDHKAQYQRLNATYSFFIHKAHRITRHIK